MDLNKFLIKNSKGEKSVTVTAFITGFVIVCFKLLASGITIGGLKMAPFSGTEFAAAVGALGAVYVLRRNEDDKNAKK